MRKLCLFHCSMVLFFIICTTVQSIAVVSHEEVTSFKHKGRAIDTAVSADGQFFYILTDKQELIVRSMNGKSQQSIKVSGNYDIMTTSPKANVVLLTDSAAQVTTVIQIESIHDFNYTSSPFKGPADAAVTVAVFSDFQ